MAVSSNRVPLSGLARRLVADGLLAEDVATQAFQDALGKRTPFVKFLVENGIVNARATEVNEWQLQLMPKAAGCP